MDNFLKTPRHSRFSSADQHNFETFSPVSSVNICSNCIFLETRILELTSKIQRLTTKFEVREKHMRQMDSLLQIKEKRAKEEELSLRKEKESLLSTILELRNSVKSSKQTTKSIEKEFQILAKENAELVLCLKKVENKNTEIMNNLKKFEDERNCIEDGIRRSILRDLEEREHQLKQAEAKIDEEFDKLSIERENISEKMFNLECLERDLTMRDQETKEKYEELYCLESRIERLKEKVDLEHQRLIQDSERQNDLLKSRESQLSSQEKSIKLKISSLDSEFHNLDCLKLQLTEQKALLSQQLSHFKALQVEMLSSKISAEPQDTYIEEMIKRLQEEESKFEQRRRDCKEAEEALKAELDFYKKKCKDYESRFLVNEVDVNISRKEFGVTSQRNIKHEELLDLEKRLKQERKEIDNTAELVRCLNNDLLSQKQLQEEEAKKLEHEKEKLLELLKRQEERAKILAIKEQDLVSFKSHLDQREKFLQKDLIPHFS